MAVKKKKYQAGSTVTQGAKPTLEQRHDPVLTKTEQQAGIDPAQTTTTLPSGTEMTHTAKAVTAEELMATTDKTLPTIYNVATLSSIKLKVPKANELDAKKYFTDARNEIAQAYKDKRIDLQVYMEDLAAMDVIEDVFDVRMDVFAHKDNTLNYAFSNKMGRPIPEIKKEGG